MRNKIKDEIAAYKCRLGVSHLRDNDYLASYSYEIGECGFKFTLLNEVAEPLVPLFRCMISNYGFLRTDALHETEGRPYIQDIISLDLDTVAGSRWNKLMPNGIPRWVRCYDNGGIDAGGSADRYTVVFTGRRAAIRGGSAGSEWPYLAMNHEPFHPMGIGLHGYSKGRPCDVRKGSYGGVPIGKKLSCLGRRIEFSDLPDQCRRAVRGDYYAIWQLLPS